MTALAQAFSELSSALQKTLEASKVNPHAVTKGNIREQKLLDALLPHLPTRFEMQLGGVVTNARGDRSLAQDIVITDAHVSRPFMFGNQLHPIEAVSAVVEVKSASSKTDIREGVEQIASVKRLLRTRLWRRDELDRVRAGHPEPAPFGALFCYELTGKADTVTRSFREACLARDPSERPDTLCVLNRFATQWSVDERLVPFSGSSPHGAKRLLRYDTREAALFFYMFLLDQVGRYQPPPLELMYYLSHGGCLEFDVRDFDI